MIVKNFALKNIYFFPTTLIYLWETLEISQLQPLVMISDLKACEIQSNHIELSISLFWFDLLKVSDKLSEWLGWWLAANFQKYFKHVLELNTETENVAPKLPEFS